MSEILYFETIKCFEKEVYHLNYHQKRVADTLKKNINEKSINQKEIKLSEYIHPASKTLLKCKVTYSKDRVVDVEYSPYFPKELKVFKLIENDGLEYKYKYLNRSGINELYDSKDNADDIIIIQKGFITDTSIANIAIKKNNQWVTPSKTLLDGTTRARLLEEGFLKPYPVTKKDLLEAESFAVMNAMVGFKEVEGFRFII